MKMDRCYLSRCAGALKMSAFVWMLFLRWKMTVRVEGTRFSSIESHASRLMNLILGYNLFFFKKNIFYFK
jgi:hypothetical protein